MTSLSMSLRSQLDGAIKQARKFSEGGTRKNGSARKALEALAVHEPDPYPHMDPPQLDLRRKLRAQAKQLGDDESQTRRGALEINHLVEKLAYDQWHRLLFARYLLENNLLISPDHGVPVGLDDCEELARALGLKDAWAVAARFAAKELPEIFRADDPVGAVELAVEDRKPLIQLVAGLPVEVFTASDSLGWCYQFWQAERKNEVNATGDKIGADDVPAVTQLFTEDYMVDFLLDNTLGAWHAGKVLDLRPALAETAENEEELRNAVALHGAAWKYLRFTKNEMGRWSPAASQFKCWPKTAKELRCLDPCMGSGHFVVAMFERIVALRMDEEAIDESTAVAVVIRDNLFGLELDLRCTQISAFNLALSAWRRVGHCNLPPMNLACSGLAPNAKEADWLKLAGDDDRLRRGMERLYRLFKDAPSLGSLINPRRSAEGHLLEAAFHELQPLLERALAPETEDDASHEMAVTARGLAKAAEILAGQFTLVATNVPYLGRLKQNSVLKDYCKSVYTEAKADLAACFVERCLEFSARGAGSVALVTPQIWLFLTTYTKLRRKLLKDQTWNALASLGEEAWWTFGMRGPRTVLIVLSAAKPAQTNEFFGIDVSTNRGQTPIMLEEKAARLSGREPAQTFAVNQAVQLDNPDASIVFQPSEQSSLLAKYAASIQGAATLDIKQFRLMFFEIPDRAGWQYHQSSPAGGKMFSGGHYVSADRAPGGRFHRTAELLEAEKRAGAPYAGAKVWGRIGIACSWMGYLPTAIYLGAVFDNSIAAIVPHRPEHLPAIWCFCSSKEFVAEVRKVNQKNQVANATLVKVPFNLAYWQRVAAEQFPGGLPKPHTDDPTEWLFSGHPSDSKQPLHVAVARLLGYRWPRQTGASFPDCPTLGPDGLEGFADDDGIVCLSATRGEAPAAERLRGLLVQALDKFDIRALISTAGPKGSESETLEEWLRDEFFEQHCALFHHRPFIWHVWDGHKSGFSALVNYHQLSQANLQKLTYAHLGDWVRRQQAAVESGEAGSDARLQAAKQLQSQLKLILEGEPPNDIFVRWKPISEQPLGWHPDLNDGVRVNIRPFLAQDIAGSKKGAGILRTKPNINWEKDAGKEPFRDQEEFPWFWVWDEKTQDFAGVGKEPDGNRWNDCHYTNEFKRSRRNT